MKIKIGEYVRSENGIIAKAISSQYEYKDDYKQDFDNDILDDWYCEDPIIKHSFDITDLIEKGDYVNGKEITNIIPPDICGDEVLEEAKIFAGSERIYTEDIKSIVTKEQFESVQYIIGG